MINRIKKFILTKYMLMVCIIAANACPAGLDFTSLSDIADTYKEKKLTPTELAHAIKDMGIQHPELVYRQAMLETGNLTSKLVRKQNNLFGMKMPRQRFTFANGKGKRNYAKYTSWAHSVADYRVYQGDKIIDNYNSFLIKRKYSETKDYVKRLMKVKISQEILSILRA